MRKIMCLVLCLGMLAIGYNVVNAESIERYCSDKSKGWDLMTEICIEKQTKAFTNFWDNYYEPYYKPFLNRIKRGEKIPNKFVPPEFQIIQDCMDRYKLKNYNECWDWVILNDCCERKFKAEFY